MKFNKIINYCSLFIISGLISIYFKSSIYTIVFLTFVICEMLKRKFLDKQLLKKDKEQEKYEFHKYLKSVILLTYTRTLKQAFKDGNKIKIKKLRKKVNKFIEENKYDFTIKPYENLAYSINETRTGINYELNIMFLMYEIEKKGLGTIFINDLLNEIDQLINNETEKKIEELKEDAYIYYLPPTIINFVYITLVLFKVIDEMIMSVLI